MLIKYIDKRFREDTLVIISQANAIIQEYLDDNMNLTLRQLYYQFIARDILPESWIDDATGSKNNPKSYSKISKVISNARLAGMIRWDAIEDKTRFVRKSSHWLSPGSILRSAASSFKMDKWMNQQNRVEVWIEKEALIGVISQTCEDLDVPYFACKGYVSQSEMWKAGMRIIGQRTDGQDTVIIHLGDHDPSGMDMTRDILDRLRIFVNEAGYPEPEVVRIALNMSQIREYNPPPNPAKMTDTRARTYLSEFGNESWELDALEPRVIRDLVRGNILHFRDDGYYDEIVSEERRHIRTLIRISENWRRL